MTVLYVIVTYLILCFSILFNEWAHSFAAVTFVVKSSILDINYSYMPFFIGINENVDYKLVAGLPGLQAVLIAFAGLLINFLFELKRRPGNSYMVRDARKNKST